MRRGGIASGALARLAGLAVLAAVLQAPVRLAIAADAPPPARAPASASVSASAAAAANPASAATPADRIPAEAFFRHPQVLEAQLSPSGAKLAITTARGGPRVGLVVLDLQGGGPPVRAAQFNDVDVVSLRWLGDDQIVFEVVDLQAGGAEAQRVGRGLFVVQTDGTQLRNLIARRNPRVVESAPLSRRALGWNHALLSVPRRGEGVDPNEIVIGAFSGSGDRLEHVQPMWLNVRTLRTRSADYAAPDGGATQWIFDGRGEARVAMAVQGGRRRIHWRGPGESGWRLLADQDSLHPPYTPRFVDELGTLYVTRADGPQGRSVLTRFDFAKGAPEPQPWVSVEGFDFQGFLVDEGEGGAPLGVRAIAEAETTVWWSPVLQKLQAQADQRLPGRINRISCRRCSTPLGVALVRSWSDREPGELWLLRPATGSWQRVARLMDHIDPRTMATVALRRIAARDGRELPVWFTLPATTRPGQPMPAVVLVHGGPWVRGGRWEWEAMSQFLASRGWLVIQPEFRGSTGYGSSHYRAGWQQWGLAMQDDVADALIWARREGLADPQRACIIGASYGGYGTLMGLIRHPELYRCGAAWVAVTDLFLLLQGSAWVRDDSSDEVRRHALPELIGDAHRDAERLRAVSPVLQASRIYAPLMLAFGERDLRVPVDHGERLRAALRQAGREPEWIVYPDEGHGWRRPENQIDFAHRLETFLGRYLDGPVP